MKADGTPETDFEAAMPLMGKLVEANARALQWTNDQLLANKEQELQQLRGHFTRLYHSMEKVYERTDSATARDATDRFAGVYSDALEGMRKYNGKGEQF